MRGKRERRVKIMSYAALPFVAIVGNSGSGKTTFMEKLISEMTGRGFKVGTIKHHHGRGLDMDKPGKDSWRHKKAGASVAVISSPFQVGMAADVDHDNEPEELSHLFTGMDIVFCEGFKRGHIFKMEVFRPEISREILCGNDNMLLAFISDSDISDVDMNRPRAPVFPLNDASETSDFLMERFKLKYTEFS